MKKLVAIATLGLTLSFSSLSFAGEYMNLYTNPTAKTEVSNEVKGGNIERDSMSFYTSPKQSTNPTGEIAQQEEDEVISVFGVQISRK
ncbi:MAG TPA: hypothetical protein VHT73_01075 [Thermodesulfobacteriota bacterium]|nr:hypothetical protein [Thermodesulfobacteriota bacterium]